MSILDQRTIERSVSKNLFAQNVPLGPAGVEAIFNLMQTPIRTPRPPSPEVRDGIPLPDGYLDRNDFPESEPFALRVRPDDLVAREIADRFLCELAAEVGGPPGGSVVNPLMADFLWIESGRALAVARLETNDQQIILNAVIGPRGVVRRRSRVVCLASPRERAAVVSAWTAPGRRRRVVARRLLRGAAKSFGCTVGDLAVACPATGLGWQLVRGVVGPRVTVVGNVGFAPAGAGVVDALRSDRGAIARACRRGRPPELRN